jgi:hypothetical protein
MKNQETEYLNNLIAVYRKEKDALDWWNNCKVHERSHMAESKAGQEYGEAEKETKKLIEEINKSRQKEMF